MSHMNMAVESLMKSRKLLWTVNRLVHKSLHLTQCQYYFISDTESVMPQKNSVVTVGGDTAGSVLAAP